MLRRFLKYSSITVLMNYIGLCLAATTLNTELNPMLVGFIMLLPILPMNFITSGIICLMEKE